MKWYIKDIKKSLKENLKYAVNYYRRLLEGTLGEITWLTLCDETALIVARKENTFKVGEDNYSLYADKGWDWFHYDTDGIEMIIMEKDQISIARRAKYVRGDKKILSEKKRSRGKRK